MKRKILALDLDGTLTNSRKEITVDTKQAIREIQRQGHLVVLASGRPTPGAQAVADKLKLDQYGGYLLSYNGARMTDCKTGELLYQATMPQDVVPRIFAMAEELGIGMMTYQNDGIIAGSRVDEYMELEAGINGLEIRSYRDPAAQLRHPVNKCLGTAEPAVAAEIEQKYADTFGQQINVGRSEPFFIELTPMEVDKASSLERLRRQIGCDREDIIACGDGFNDKCMIQYAGIGVAMANAQEVVKEAADYVTEKTNDEDGIVEVIEKFILNSST
ncbi:MAG: Cof-type HAD-IIB family hydrolase [Lachnospiraceae bacterium]|nr:Cof-type HAD-IIB family hydrolase [Lachnospiraceae bacterium]